MPRITDLVPPGEEVICVTHPAMLGRWKSVTTATLMLLIGLVSLIGATTMSEYVPALGALWRILDWIASPTTFQSEQTAVVLGPADFIANDVFWIRSNFALLMLAAGALEWARVAVASLRSTFVVTNRRVLAARGVLMLAMGELTANRIRGVEMRRTALGQIFGFASIVVYGIGGEYVLLRNTREPIRILRAIEAIQG